MTKLTEPQLNALKIIKAAEPHAYEFDHFKKRKPFKYDLLMRLWLNLNVIDVDNGHSSSYCRLNAAGQKALEEAERRV